VITSLLAFITAVAPLAFAIWQEVLSQKAQADRENKTFALDQVRLRAVVQEVLDRHVAQAPGQSAGAGSAWDAADQNKPSKER
jgi:hypothetical protein